MRNAFSKASCSVSNFNFEDVTFASDEFSSSLIPSGVDWKTSLSNLRHEIAKRNPFHRINGIVLIIKDEESSTNTQTHTSTSSIGIIIHGRVTQGRVYTAIVSLTGNQLWSGGSPPLDGDRETIWWNVNLVEVGIRFYQPGDVCCLPILGGYCSLPGFEGEDLGRKKWCRIQILTIEVFVIRIWMTMTSVRIESRIYSNGYHIQ